VIGLSFLTSILIFFELIGRPPTERHFEKVIFDWVVSGSFQTVIGYQIDPLSILMALVVSGSVSSSTSIPSGTCMMTPGLRDISPTSTSSSS